MSDSVLFTYGVPFVGVLLVAVGIGAAVPGAYGLLQDDETCGNPTIALETPEETERRFGENLSAGVPAGVTQFEFDELAPDERAAVEEALDDAIGEVEVVGEFPNYPAFDNGSIVTVDGEPHYVNIVSENPCYPTPPLQFPLGVFAIALGGIGILTPPVYDKLVELEEGLRE